MAIIIGSEDTFKSKIKEEGLIVVYFFATWCGPCKMFASTYEETSKEQTEVKMHKVDVDTLPSIASDYGIVSIPTILLFKNGQEIDRKTGVPSDLNGWINENKDMGMNK